jgi:hypothetical protein
MPTLRLLAVTAIRNLVFERAIDAGHNDLYDHPDFPPAAREALKRVETAPATDGLEALLEIKRGDESTRNTPIPSKRHRR